ncbi:hypothetical protein [Devosia sp. FJ2-5-3]|uniref:hypothetical protein n=1 Tax=Devosia sp. FJ2-5-3 TaxID=2976680 RepID=UPI0023D89B27|nr:hypothetical protein [Devosia sp. FJ2-5-3]WEJ60197.1 hypothetical protein N0P34_09245 [Devosia sp. FJ2-5-3]
MPLDTALIVRHTEKLDTIAIRLARPADQDALRQQMIDGFKAMATDIGKMVTVYADPAWSMMQGKMHDLRWAAVQADESRAATFSHVGAEMALLTALIAFASGLGFTLEDAATAPIPAPVDDNDAMCAVEGHDMKVAAE